MKTSIVYFSATYTTHRVVGHLAKQITEEITEYDITNHTPSKEIIIPKNELLIVGIPVYAGRIPEMAVDRIRQFKGEGTPAIAVAVYGNRDYDDALLELSDLLADNGFQVISAGAFIAQHSIFPKVGAQRPDADDYQQINVFASESYKILNKNLEKLLP
ncbi:MAG: flavodoxin family protein, partial [Bacteroidaceae bacterium]|nr:flavodoxin family protein [Bacteroidaceae bacterium]